MNREEWKRASSALRGLLRDLPRQNPRAGARIRKTKDKFGALYNRRYRMWHIWNCESKNVIATVRFRRTRVIVRYRPNSYYAEIFKGYAGEHENGNFIVYPSRKLFRHKEWIMQNIHDHCLRQLEREKMEREVIKQKADFLEINSASLQAQFTPMNINLEGLSISPREQESIRQMQQEAMNSYHRLREQEMRDMVYGRPQAGQTSVTSSTTMNEHDLQRAVEYMRNMWPDVERVEAYEDPQSMRTTFRGRRSSGDEVRLEVPRLEDLVVDRPMPRPEHRFNMEFPPELTPAATYGVRIGNGNVEMGELTERSANEESTGR